MKWRYEYKMVVENLILEEARNIILHNPVSFFERYPMRKVNNIYFDTNDLSNYYNSLSGISRRSKLRFRWYGEPTHSISGSLELKEKKGMLISKTLQNIDNRFDLKAPAIPNAITTGANRQDSIQKYVRPRREPSDEPFSAHDANRRDLFPHKEPSPAVDDSRFS